jgi:hypothetical protein
MTDCSICLCKNGKIYRELGCGHRFHHKCLSLCQTKTCPLCRTPYENIVLRERVLSSSDKLKLKTYCDDIKALINECNSFSETIQKSKRLHIINIILKYIIDHKYMLTGKFPLNHFIGVIKNKLNGWNMEIIEDANLKKKYITQYKRYSTLLLNFLEKFILV